MPGMGRRGHAANGFNGLGGAVLRTGRGTWYVVHGVVG
jgi:hypothetical protein